MKNKILLLGCAILATTGLLSADPTYSTTTPKTGPYIPSQHPKVSTDLHVRPTGVFYDVPKYGFQLLNPLAKPELGYGEKYAAYATGPFLVGRMPDGPVGERQDPSGGGQRSEREQGGIKVFGFEF